MTLDSVHQGSTHEARAADWQALQNLGHQIVALRARRYARRMHWLGCRIAAAMERGELSYAKVRALTRVACPNTEDTLLMYALHGTAVHVERIVRDFRRCKEAEELGREAQQQIDRKLTWFHDQDGMLVINARLPAEVGQMFIKAIEAACEEIPAEDVSCMVRPTFARRKSLLMSWRRLHSCIRPVGEARRASGLDGNARALALISRTALDRPRNATGGWCTGATP